MTKNKRRKKRGVVQLKLKQASFLLSDLIAVRKDLREERGMDWKEVCFRHDTQFQAVSHCDGGRIDAVHLNSVIREGKPGISASFFFWCNKARFRIVDFFSNNASFLRLNYYMPLWF